MSDHHYRLAITPLSPVHMGTDADYEPTGYVIDDGALFEFDAIAALQALPETERKKLDRILAGKPDDAMLRQVQGFFHANRERLIGHSRRQVRVNKSIEAFYKDRVGKVAQHEHGGRKVQNKLEIERTAWNPVSGKPILPGSGLKGAIRTALLDRENDGRRLGGGERNRDLQNRLFDFRPGKFELDPMRLIRLGDAPLRNGIDLPTEVLFALNRKKRPVEKNGTEVQSRAEQQGLYQLLECLPPLFDRPFAGTLTVQDLDQVGNERNTPRLRFGIDDIATACNRFYQPILERELALLRQRGFVDAHWADRIEQLLRQLQPPFEKGRAFLLRAGRHSGAESVTLNGVRSIKIMKGRGEKPDWSDSPKTLWLAGHERQAQRDLLPFGWLLVEIDPTDQPPISAVETVREIEKWQRQVDSRVAALWERVEREWTEEAAREQRLREEQRRAAAEEEVRRAQKEAERLEREAALAKMAPIEREIHGFESIPEALKVLESGKWGDDQSEAARYLKVRMQGEGVWVEVSKKKNPAKDKAHQRTLLVRRHIDEGAE